MHKEAPFVTKSLKIVSLAILVATMAIAATAAYSGYEEYGALTNSVESNSASQLRVALNGSTMTISGLNVPNKMTFPLTLELLGNVSLDNATVGNFDSGVYVIQPNESQDINLSVPINFETFAWRREGSSGSNTKLKRALNYNHGFCSYGPASRYQHFENLRTHSAGPIFGGLNVGLNTSGARLSSDGQSVEVPMVLTWQNTSPLSSGSLWLGVDLTGIPGKSGGNYGSASGIH